MDFIRARKIVVYGKQDNIVLDGPGKKLELQYGSDLIQESLDGTDQNVHRADSVGHVIQTKDSKGNWVTREEITGGVDVAEHRIRNSVAKIIPASAGADALHIRTYDDKDNIKITESGSILKWDGSAWREVAYLDPRGLVFKTNRISFVSDQYDAYIYARDFDSCYVGFTNYLTEMILYPRGKLTIINDYGYVYLRTSSTTPGSGALQIFTRDSAGNYQIRFTLTENEDIPKLYLMSKPADSANTLRDSLILVLKGRYWDAVAGTSKDRNAAIFHRMLSTTPTSEITFQIAGVDYMRVGDRGVKIDKVVFDPGSSVSIDAGATYTLPAGTYYVNLGPNTVAEVYDDIAGTWITLISAGGKGIVISDGSNARLRNTGTVAESSTMRRVL
jgi:hypothetical protein